MSDCPFCKLARREIASDVVFEDDDAFAFRDLNPQAPVHVLVIPKRHIDNLAACGSGDTPLLGRLLAAARAVADATRISSTGYRTVINSGSDGGQTVGHLHIHVLGGRPMGWPPG